jgi:hypothetical protein
MEAIWILRLTDTSVSHRKYCAAMGSEGWEQEFLSVGSCFCAGIVAVEGRWVVATTPQAVSLSLRRNAKHGPPTMRKPTMGTLVL